VHHVDDGGNVLVRRRRLLCQPFQAARPDGDAPRAEVAEDGLPIKLTSGGKPTPVSTRADITGLYSSQSE